MVIDFHTHGKLAKKFPFSTEYTDWLFGEADQAGLDALCLTEHFNTLQFEEIYRYISSVSEKEGDTLVLSGGLHIFPGMETDIAEGGHILSIGPMEAILELNQRLEPYKEKDKYLEFDRLFELFAQYPVMVGAAHPFREGGHIPELSEEQLARFHFLDLNGKDIAENRYRTEQKTFELGQKLEKPVVAGSDTHQAVQYGCIKTCFENSVYTVMDLYEEMKAQRYSIEVSTEAVTKVKMAGLVKRLLKEIHALGGNYVAMLTGEI